MKKIYTASTVLLFSFLLSAMPSFAQTPDTKLYTIIPYSHDLASMFSRPPQNLKSTTLNKKDVLVIHSLFDECIKQYNSKTDTTEYRNFITGNQPAHQHYFIDPRHSYFKQIVPIDSNGIKLAWVNCFCSKGLNNKSQYRSMIMMAEDGGLCFFNFMVNLTTGKYYDMHVNNFE